MAKLYIGALIATIALCVAVSDAKETTQQEKHSNLRRRLKPRHEDWFKHNDESGNEMDSTFENQDYSNNYAVSDMMDGSDIGGEIMYEDPDESGNEMDSTLENQDYSNNYAGSDIMDGSDIGGEIMNEDPEAMAAYYVSDMMDESDIDEIMNEDPEPMAAYYDYDMYEAEVEGESEEFVNFPEIPVFEYDEGMSNYELYNPESSDSSESSESSESSDEESSGSSESIDSADEKSSGSSESSDSADEEKHFLFYDEVDNSTNGPERPVLSDEMDGDVGYNDSSESYEMDGDVGNNDSSESYESSESSDEESSGSSESSDSADYLDEMDGDVGYYDYDNNYDNNYDGALYGEISNQFYEGEDEYNYPEDMYYDGEGEYEYSEAMYNENVASTSENMP